MTMLQLGDTPKSDWKGADMQGHVGRMLLHDFYFMLRGGRLFGELRTQHAAFGQCRVPHHQVGHDGSYFRCVMGLGGTRPVGRVAWCPASLGSTRSPLFLACPTRVHCRVGYHAV